MGLRQRLSVSTRLRSKPAVLAIAAVGLVFYFTLAPTAPQDQTLRFILGDAAPRVVELRARYRPTPSGPKGDADEPSREVTFHYAAGAAPRIVSHEPRLANGDYVVQIEIATSSGQEVNVDRRVSLQGGTTSLDLAQPLANRSATEAAPSP